MSQHSERRPASHFLVSTLLLGITLSEDTLFGIIGIKYRIPSRKVGISIGVKCVFPVKVNKKIPGKMKRFPNHLAP